MIDLKWLLLQMYTCNLWNIYRGRLQREGMGTSLDREPYPQLSILLCHACFRAAHSKRWNIKPLAVINKKAILRNQGNHLYPVGFFFFRLEISLGRERGVDISQVVPDCTRPLESEKLKPLLLCWKKMGFGWFLVLPQFQCVVSGLFFLLFNFSYWLKPYMVRIMHSQFGFRLKKACRLDRGPVYPSKLT